jgi:hypothetical protein
MKKKDKFFDFWVVTGLLIFGALVGYYAEARNVPLGFLYLGIPSIYLFFRERKNYNKIFWGTLIFGVLFGAIFDFMMVINGAWDVPNLTIPWRLFGLWPVENIIGYSLMALFVLVFYEHFIDDEKSSRLSKKHSKIFMLCLVMWLVLITAYATSPTPLQISHVYLWGGLGSILFPIIFMFYNTNVIKKFAPLAMFFFFVWFLLEIVGMKLGGWIFPSSEFIGLVNVFGVTFPAEEIIFWMLWYPATIVAYYEYFIDDGK